mmetsp:Transcript_18411/g.17525  ORF Transcript_18411/g.17525 Transcript_18411/m.17525 type:complete len:243 (-) Transcript_18411:160-888(-)
MLQVANFLILHCGVQDKNLLAFDVQDKYEKKFQSRTIERSFGAISKCAWEPSGQHFVLGMKNGWLSLYQINSVIGGINEKVSKQVFVGKDILCMTEMNQEGIFSVGLLEGGISLFKVTLGLSKALAQSQPSPAEIIKLQYHFLREKTISCLLEVKPNLLLGVSYMDCKYYLVDLLKFTETLSSQGFSSKAISICKFPGFSFEKFPMVLTKEQDWVCVLDISNGNCYKLQQVRGHTNSNVMAA